MKIKVDNREHTLIKLLNALKKDYKYDFEVVVEKLDLGDIIICKDEEELLIIERKNLNDLASSLRDGRYNEQSYRLNGLPVHNHNIIYLVEGNISFYSSKYSKVKPETLYVTMFCLYYFKGFSVIRTFDIAETAEYILRLTDKLNRGEKKYGYYHEKFVPSEKTYTNVVHKVKKKNITPENIGEIILSQIPGISSTTSKVILNKFGSLYNLLKEIEKDRSCLESLSYKTKAGKERRISKTSIDNIIQYLLYQETNIIKIDT